MSYVRRVHNGLERNTGYLQWSATVTPRTPQTHTAQHGARARKQERVTFHNRNIQATGEGRQHVSPRFFLQLQSWLFNAKKHPSGEKGFHSPDPRIIVIHSPKSTLLAPRKRQAPPSNSSVEERMLLLSLSLRQKPASRKRLLLSFPSQALSSNVRFCSVLKKNTAAPSLSGTARQTCALLGAACLDEGSGNMPHPRKESYPGLGKLFTGVTKLLQTSFMSHLRLPLAHVGFFCSVLFP